MTDEYRVVFHVRDIRGPDNPSVKRFDSRADAIAAAIEWVKQGYYGVNTAIVDDPAGFRARYIGAPTTLGYRVKQLG